MKKCHKKWWQIQWVTKFGDKYVTKNGDKFSELPNLVTNLDTNLVVTKFGDQFSDKFSGHQIWDTFMVPRISPFLSSN